MDTAEIILQELRELREDYNNDARAKGERLSRLDQQVYSLVGNSQPGRVGKLEAAVQTLQEMRWWLVGPAAGVSGVVSVAAYAAAFFAFAQRFFCAAAIRFRASWLSVRLEPFMLPERAA
jgi:hypothetical protein